MAKQPARTAPDANGPRYVSVSKWWQFTLSALAGAVITLVSVVLAFASVRGDAEAGAALVPKVEKLQLQGAADTERWKALNLRLDRQDRILEKLSK